MLEFAKRKRFCSTSAFCDTFDKYCELDEPDMKETGSVVRSLGLFIGTCSYDRDDDGKQLGAVSTVFELKMQDNASRQSLVNVLPKVAKALAFADYIDSTRTREEFSYLLGALSVLSAGRGRGRKDARLFPDVSAATENSRCLLAGCGRLDGVACHDGHRVASERLTQWTPFTIWDRCAPSGCSGQVTYLTPLPTSLAAYMVANDHMGDDFLMRELLENREQVMGEPVDVTFSRIYEEKDAVYVVPNSYGWESTLFVGRALIDVVYAKMGDKYVKAAGYDIYGVCQKDFLDPDEFSAITVYGNPVAWADTYKSEAFFNERGHGHSAEERKVFENDSVSSIGYIIVKRFDSIEEMEGDINAKAPLDKKELELMFSDIPGEAG